MFWWFRGFGLRFRVSGTLHHKPWPRKRSLNKYSWPRIRKTASAEEFMSLLDKEVRKALKPAGFRD